MKSRCCRFVAPALALPFLAWLTPSLSAQSAPAATTASPPGKKEEAVKLEAFSVTGTNIKRLDFEQVLPVTVFSKDLIEARNALTPVEMLMALPQLTSVPLNESTSGGANSRGDNANVNLRGIGATYTLVLLNGRRVAPHPTTSPDAGQMASYANVNQLPTQGLERIDILRDGASSIYGSDAVAGVINYRTRRDFRGTEVRTRIGVPEHGAGESYQGTLTFGRDFARGKGRWLTTLDYLKRQDLPYSERALTANADHSRLAPAPFNVPGSAFDDRATIGAFPTFRIGAGTATNYFRPVNGVPTLTATAPTRAANPEYYFPITQYQNLGQTKARRVNWFNNVEFDVNDRITAVIDVSFYHSTTHLLRQPINFNAPTSEAPAPLAIDNPYNPYGSRFHSPTGAPNADGTPRLTGTPQTVSLLALSLIDNGQEDVVVNSGIYRVVGGLRGKLGGDWTWDSAALYTRAYSSDISPHGVRESLFGAALRRTDATAFNPFGYTFRVAGNAVVADRPFTNPRSVFDTFVQAWRRDGSTAITSADLRTAGPLFRYWGNTVTLAAGGEFRIEEFRDQRAPFVGMNPASSGLDPNNNDFVLASPKPDSSGDRTVYSAYVEANVPVVGREKQVPLVDTLELTASARYENYSDFGTTTRPKYGVNWRPWRGLMVRGSLNKGFAAPNLPTLYAPNQYTIDSLPGRVDPYLSQTLGTAAYVMRNYSSGNTRLKPITSDGRSAGLVLEVPKIKGLSVTADYWKIEQSDVVGSRLDTQILDSDNALLRAYTASQLAAGRTISQIDLGSGTASYKGDPAIVRNAPTAQDIAAFAAYNASRPAAQQAAVVGTIFSRSAPYENIAKGHASGMDFSLAYQLPDLRAGRFALNTEWSYLIKTYQLRAGAGGALVKNERMEVDGTARWRGTGALTWRKARWNASLSAYYIGSFADSAATTTATVYSNLGEPRYLSKQLDGGNLLYRYRVRDVISYNFAIGYRFPREENQWLRNTSVRLGIINVTDQEPPLTSDTAGYSTSVHSSLFPGRTWTLELVRQF
ncbi:MAG: TonB-dependent receptor [Verrucomicrobia bacterium]|nr:TonB-dependent receptor [Verrucomicrobiota bacterium]